MILRNERNEPPGGWRYKQAETGLIFMEDSLPALCRKIAEHRRYKDIPVGTMDDISLEVQRQICASMNDNPVFCRSEIGFITQVSVESDLEIEMSTPEKMPDLFKPQAKVESGPPKTPRKRNAKRNIEN